MCEVFTDIFANGQWMINDKLNIVTEILLSYVRCNPNLALLDFGNVIVMRDHLLMDKVKIVSGGASGHEPAYSGFVGKGMLTASIQGDIFQSPSPDLVFRSLKQLCRRNPHGILIIINSRLSDRLAFGLAQEKIRSLENVQARMIVVNDEIKTVGEKQGLTGTILVQKIAGGMVELGYFLDEIYYFCKDILKDISTINVRLKNPETPNIKIASSARFLKEKEMEFCAGFHGEPGFLKIPLKSTEEVVKIMLDNLINCNENNFSYENLPLVVIVINNLGISTKLEERIFLFEVVKQLEQYQIKIARIYCASLITSLNSLGFSLTLMRVSNQKVLDYLDCPTDVTSWTPYCFGEIKYDLDPKLDTTYPKEELGPKKKRGPDVSEDIAEIFELMIKFVAECLTTCERMLNLMDSEDGDSDTGTNMKLAALAITQKLSHKNMENPYAFLKELSEILEQNTCGLSSLLYAIMFSAAAKPFAHLPEDQFVDARIWLNALNCAIKAIKHYGKVKVGDRTLLDPLVAASYAITCTLDQTCVESEEKIKNIDIESLKNATLAAEESAKKTKRIQYADPGAHAISIIFRAIYESVKMKIPSDSYAETKVRYQF